MRQKDLLDELLRELNILKKKIQEVEELIEKRSDKVRVEDLARRTSKALVNCNGKMKAIQKRASKKERR